MASPAQTCRRYAVWAGRKLGGARTVQRALAPPFFAIRRLSEKTIDSPHVEGLRRPPPPPSTAEVNLPLRNRGHYSRTPNYPARESYPALPSELFQKPLDVENAQKIAEWFSREIALLPTEEQVHRPHGPLWRHKLVAQWGDTEFRAIGEDASKEHAQAAALMHLILQLHSHNLLSRLRLSDSRVHAGPELLGQLTLQERFSKLHVYNYAARFGLLPQVSYYRARNSGVGFTWTIALPEHDILATASAREMNDAELLACIKFKREAEARWQRLGLPALQLSDGISVGLHNAAKLIGYWESLQGGVTIKFKATRLYAKFESKLPRWRVSPIWRKERLSIPLDCDVGSATLGQAKCIAEIITAVALTQMNPDLLERFEAALQVNGGNLPIRAPPIKLVIPDGGVSLQNAVEMLEASHLLHMDVTELGGYDEPRVDVPLHENSILFAINMREFMHTTQRSAQSRSEELLLRHIPAQNSGRRRTLPVNRFQDEILALVEENPISIITGSTGSGKSTQIPQIILEDAIRRGRGASCNIICTQPRRIAAASLAQHVADERGEALGEVVGYHVGGESAECHYGGSITYCTAEILVLQLELGLEQVLNGVSHIIVDEVHERDQPTERLLATLRMAFAYHMSQGKPVPRLILMTATLDIDLFERYYQQRLPDGSLANPATLQVPGGTFEIKNKYLSDLITEFDQQLPRLQVAEILGSGQTLQLINTEAAHVPGALIPKHQPLIDWQIPGEANSIKNHWVMSAPLIAATIAHLMANTESGAVLVFVPGWREIKDVEDELRTRRWSSIDFNDPERFKIVLLHSLFPSGLTEATDPVPEGCRRILIATDIAETSLTFPDIKYVIDSGKRRSPEYDALSSVNKLYRTWVSKASATQRAGRAGRVKSGEYYALFSEQRHRSMAPFRPPEAMTPEAIQRVILRVRLHFPTIPVEKYFSNWLEPPPQLQLDTALRRLQDEDVLTEHGEVTPFGRLVARLGTSPSMARMILLGVVFQCLDPILVIAAMALHNVPLFTHPDSAVAAMQHRNLRLTLSEGARSDHIALLNAYRTMTRRERTHGTDAACDWAAANDVSLIHYKSVSVGARRLSKVLAQYGLIPDHRMDMANLRSENTALLTALICAGLAPNIAAHASSYRFLTKGGLHAEVPHESLLRPQEWRAGTWMPNPLKGTLCVYSGIHQATDPLEGNDFTLLRDVTPVSELAVALFGGPLNVADGDLLVDGWLPLRTSGSDEAVHQIAKFRELWDSALATTFKGLAVGIGSDASREVKREIAALEDVVQAVVSLLDQDERARLERAAALLPRRELESSNVEDTS